MSDINVSYIPTCEDMPIGFDFRISESDSLSEIYFEFDSAIAHQNELFRGKKWYYSPRWAYQYTGMSFADGTFKFAIKGRNDDDSLFQIGEFSISGLRDGHPVMSCGKGYGMIYIISGDPAISKIEVVDATMGYNKSDHKTKSIPITFFNQDSIRIDLSDVDRGSIFSNVLVGDTVTGYKWEGDNLAVDFNYVIQKDQYEFVKGKGWINIINEFNTERKIYYLKTEKLSRNAAERKRICIFHPGQTVKG